jgi:hypothetical protein
VAVLRIPEEGLIVSLYTSEEFILRVFKFLTALPFKSNSKKIIKFAVEFVDPSPQLLRKVVAELIPCVENEIPCLSTLNVCLAFYNVRGGLFRPYSSSSAPRTKTWTRTYTCTGRRRA